MKAAPKLIVTSIWARRRVIAFVLVVVFAAAFLYLRASNTWRSCSTNTRTNLGRVSRDTSCEGIPITYLIAPLLVVIALLWPDISEVTVAGLGTIKKRPPQPEAASTANDSVAEPVPPTSAEQTRLEARVRELAPWMNVAERMHQPRFLEALRAAAPSGKLADTPDLVEADRARLARIETRGQPFDIDALQCWREANELSLQRVARTHREIEHASPESVRVAANLADNLWADLERRGLV